LRRLHRLTVDDGGAGSRLAPLFQAHLFAEGCVHPFPRAVVAPRAEVAPDRRPGRKLMRQGTPLAPCPIQVQNGIDHFSDAGGSWVSTWLGGRDERLEDGPFLLGQIDFSN